MNRNVDVRKSEESGTPYKEDPSVDPSVLQEQGAAPPSPDKAGAAPLFAGQKKTQNPDDNLRVITKLAHEVLDLLAETPDVEIDEVVDGVKRRCAVLDIVYWPGDVVDRAIQSAIYQRHRAGKKPILRGTAGECAWRLSAEAT